jgi:AraC-like DNA-binding protein
MKQQLCEVTRQPSKAPPPFPEPRLADDSTVSIRAVLSLLEYTERAGVASNALLREASIPPSLLEEPGARVVRAKVFRLYELAMDRTGDAALGIHWSQRHSEHAFMPVSHLFTSAPTLRRAVDAVTRFYPLLSDERIWELEERGDAASIRFLRFAGESRAVRRLTGEVMVGGLVRFLSQFGVNRGSRRVCFDYPEPDHHAEYTKAFGEVVHFDQPFVGVAFARTDLDLPTRYHDENVHEALRTLAEDRLVLLPKAASFAERTRAVLIRQRGPNRTDMREVARAFSLSARSLRRRLAVEGANYDAIAGDAFSVVAKNLLGKQRLTIQETAHQMGYQDVSAFHRAFKRWTGHTPNAYQKGLRTAHER